MLMSCSVVGLLCHCRRWQWSAESAQ